MQSKTSLLLSTFLLLPLFPELAVFLTALPPQAVALSHDPLSGSGTRLYVPPIPEGHGSSSPSGFTDAPSWDVRWEAGRVTHSPLSQELGEILSKLKLSPKKPSLSTLQPSLWLRTEKHVLQFYTCPA